MSADGSGFLSCGNKPAALVTRTYQSARAVKGLVQVRIVIRQQFVGLATDLLVELMPCLSCPSFQPSERLAKTLFPCLGAASPLLILSSGVLWHVEHIQ
jgi:hypothetical protein